MQYFAPSSDMFAWQDDSVAAQDPDAIFLEAIGVPVCATVQDTEAAFGKFDADDFINALITPQPSPTSNKRSLDLTCDPIYDKDSTLFQTVRSEKELELKSLKGCYSDSPLHTCFDSDDGITPTSFDDPNSISGVMDNGRTPTICRI